MPLEVVQASEWINACKVRGSCNHFNSCVWLLEGNIWHFDVESPAFSTISIDHGVVPCVFKFQPNPTQPNPTIQGRSTFPNFVLHVI